MTFIQFLIDTPVVAFLLFLGLLVTVVPTLASLLFRNKSGHPDAVSAPIKGALPKRFLGTQMDIAILIFGLVLLLGVIGSIHKAFFG